VSQLYITRPPFNDQVEGFVVCGTKGGPKPKPLPGECR